MNREKALVCDAIDREDAPLRVISLDIWNNPELCFNEHHAHKVLTDFLEERGFYLERHYVTPTAFRASMESKENSEETPTIGVMCEYDALPGIGHACGHNLIAILGLAIACGIKEALDSGVLKGKLVVLGCPAEEGGGGKIDLIHAGAYKNMDIAMMAHPFQSNLPKPKSSAMSPVTVSFGGKASHASASPWLGVNALDAAVLCYQSVSCMRQQFKPSWRVHGVFTKAGEKPNIIPENAELLYYCRAPSTKELKDLRKKITRCFEGAAAASECKVSYAFDAKSYDSLVSNERLASLYVANGKVLGIEFEHDQQRLARQVAPSTDMGNVSRVLPSIHPGYSLHTEAACHTVEFRDVAYAEKSHELTLLHAKALAMAAVDVYQNPDIVKLMKSDLQQQLQTE